MTAVTETETVQALETLGGRDRELVITGYLIDARDRLDKALSETGPETVSAIRAELATVAEMAKRLGVSKEIQEDAVEMVRRSEFALGKAIRAGQERGEIASPGHNYSRNSKDSLTTNPSPVSDFASKDELSGNGAGIYHLSDSVTVEEFDEALDRAKEERNLSRANVVKKIKDVKSGAEAKVAKWEEVADLASRGYTSRQIAKRIGMSEYGLKCGAEREGIAFPADRVVGRTRRLDTSRIVRESTATLEGVVSSLALINVDDIDDPEEAQTWVDSLNQSIKALSKARTTIKESIS